MLLFLPFEKVDKCSKLSGCGDNPRDGVGEIQTFRCMVGSKNGQDPNDTESTHARNGHDHGCDRGANAAQRTGRDLHKAAEEIGKTDVQQTDHAKIDRLWVGWQIYTK